MRRLWLALSFLLLAACAHAQEVSGTQLVINQPTSTNLCAGIPVAVLFVAAAPNPSNIPSCYASATVSPFSSVTGFTYTPGTGATSFVPDATGLLISKAGGVSRVTTAGVVGELAEVNLIFHSQDGFTTGGAYWGCFHATGTQNTATAPDGTGTGATFTLTASDGSCSNNNGGGVAQTANQQYSDSVYVGNTSSLTNVNLRAFDGTNSAGATCTFSTLVCAVNLNSGYTGVSVDALQRLGTTANYRICIHYTAPATGSLFTKDGIFSGGASTGSETIWGFQHQTGPSCGSYLPTTTASQSRAADTLGETYTSMATYFGTVYFSGGQSTYVDPTSPIDLTVAGTPWYGQPIQQLLVTVGQPTPAPAITAGYLTKTFDTQSFSTTNVDTAATYGSGFQWYPCNAFSFGSTRSTISFSGGAASIIATSFDNCGYSSAGFTAGSPFFVGTAFGGGFYMEMQISINAAGVDASTGWPAGWSMSLQHMAGLTTQQWPGQAAGYAHFWEGDFFEADFTGAGHPEGSSLHDWYGIFNVTCPTPANNYCNLANNLFASVLPTTANVWPYHRYGALWMPATASTAGSITSYFDGVQIGSPVTWSQYVGASDAPPPTGQPWAFGVVDTQQLVLILSSGTAVAAPINVKSVTVWQLNGSGNVSH